MLDGALEALARAGMPAPSFAVATGRGLALVWLHTPVPRAALPRWRACQGAVHDALRHLGADRLATDAARVLRLVGTGNGASGTLVEALTPVGEAWDFDVRRLLLSMSSRTMSTKMSAGSSIPARFNVRDRN